MENQWKLTEKAVQLLREVSSYENWPLTVPGTDQYGNVGAVDIKYFLLPERVIQRVKDYLQEIGA